MHKGRVLRVAPERNGEQIATAWRIWTQGDEFYAWSRDSIDVAKISFHRNNNWQLRLGTAVQRLNTGLPLSGGWRHVLQLTFLVADDAVRPFDPQQDKVVLVDTPSGDRLVIDLLVTESPNRLSPMPFELQGYVLKEAVLRGGRTLLVLARVMPLTSEDDAAIADMRSKLRINFKDRLPDLRDAYVQSILSIFDEGKGNLVAVIPVFLECFAVEPPPPSQMPA